jgi:hypothetical protein
MVDTRLRRRTLARASLGTGTPCQTRTPELFFPAGQKSWVDADHPAAYDPARRPGASCERPSHNCRLPDLSHPPRRGARRERD